LLKHFRGLLSLLLLSAVLCVSAAADEASAGRPASWATPVAIKGVPNLHKVSDNLYRSAQPEKEGLYALKSLGIKTIVCLRDNHSDEEMLKGYNFIYHSIPVKTWDIKADQVAEFLRIVNDPSQAPVLVHCQHGADRTGTFSAVYRVAVQGWSKENAIEEMKKGGYGFHSIWFHLPSWIKKLDVDQVKIKAGLTVPVTSDRKPADGAGEPGGGHM
jgi:uncharacterized protein (TIGR01244 family)